MVNVPVAVVAGPACVTAMGTTMSLVVPFTLSLPDTSYLPPPLALMAVDAKVAVGNLATLNQVALGTSASVSGEPNVALEVAMVKATLPASGFFGSNAMSAVHLANRPSTGTPISLMANVIWLWAGTTWACAKTAPVKASEAARTRAVGSLFMEGLDFVWR